MYILLENDFDQLTMTHFDDISAATEAYDRIRKTSNKTDYHIVLLKIETGTPFGFGPTGDVFGAKVLFQYQINC
jgi:hypothetical protein